MPLGRIIVDLPEPLTGSTRPDINVLKTGPVSEPEKLPVHGSLVELVVEPWSNR